MRRVVTLLFLALAFGCETSSSVKAPSKNYFVKYFGPNGNQKAVGLIVNNDGTFYILGNSRPPAIATQQTTASQQIYLAKANALGDTIWQTTYGSSSAELEARDFKIANGSIVVAANRKASPTSTQSNIQLIQFKLNGDTVQSKILPIESGLIPTPKNEWVNGLTVLSDGGFLVSGYADFLAGTGHIRDALHLRTDANFNLKLKSTGEWNPTSGRAGANSYAVAAFQTSGDSTYVFGNTDAPAPSIDEDFWAVKIDAKGDQQGVANYVVNNSDDELTHALKATQGGYLLSGLSIDNNSQSFSLKISKIRFDNLSFDSKDIQFNFPGKSLGKGSSIKYATTCNSISGYFALTNTFNNATGNSDILLLKLDLTLQETWSNPVILGGDGDDTAAAVAELPDGHIMVLGTLNLGNPPEQFKIALMKLNSAGKLSD